MQKQKKKKGKVVLGDECEYRAHHDNPDWTYFEQQAFMELPPFPFSSVCEQYMVKSYDKNTGEGRQIDLAFIKDLVDDGWFERNNLKKSESSPKEESKVGTSEWQAERKPTKPNPKMLKKSNRDSTVSIEKIFKIKRREPSIKPDKLKNHVTDFLTKLLSLTIISSIFFSFLFNHFISSILTSFIALIYLLSESILHPETTKYIADGIGMI